MPPHPPTRREQLELDELLSDIYRGIETLPDSSKSSRAGAFLVDKQPAATSGSNRYNSSNNNRPVVLRSEIKEYELPEDSPLVRQHKQELAQLRQSRLHQSNTLPATSPGATQRQQQQQPYRSTLKRHTNSTPDGQQQQSQSLASYVTSNTPDNKRRVRIVEHPDKLAKGDKAKEKVKYVNTNKLIYHQEQNPDDDPEQPVSYDSRYVAYRDVDDDDDDAASSDSDEQQQQNKTTRLRAENDDDDDQDGVTRVEYYHTSWLDRQLGRASKRRSSKELNERQVKEKAMIEELKNSLKNGAITLKRSFKSKKHNKNKQSESVDDYFSDKPSEPKQKSSIFATIPRKYTTNPNPNPSPNPKPSSRPTANSRQASDYLESSYPSATLPNNSYGRAGRNDHTLLQSHYRQDIGHKLPPRQSSSTLSRLPSTSYPSDWQDTMREPQRANNSNTYSNSNNANSAIYNTTTPTSQQMNNSNIYSTGNGREPQTISSIPSANEVVRSALSRSNSQASVNQLNKTINSLPTSPSPTTPTQQLRAASPSLSPSPVGLGANRCQTLGPSGRQHLTSSNQTSSINSANCYSSNTMGSSYRTQQQQQQQPHQRQQQQQQLQPGQFVVQGTRTIPATRAEQQQQVYANPHASLMQHRLEQQSRQPAAKNQASIREFNELDSLLKSLSPNSISVTPAFNSRPAQASFGLGDHSSNQATNIRQQPAPMAGAAPNNQIYAKVHKPTPTYSNENSRGNQPAANYAQPQQQYLPQQQQQQQNFTIDVTNPNEPDYCTQRQNYSSFEAPTEILPSMEDYQNITKLNPVRNHHWYKPKMSRDLAISLLKDKPQGTFIVRDSTSFRGAYGLAVKVSKLPKNVLNNSNLRDPNGDPSAELIRHFLIEPTSDGGVRLKGYANEPVFNSLPNLIYQHSLTELALPCKLIIPRADIEDPQFNFKQKQFFDDFVASKEIAKHMPYETYAPNGGYRKYPGDVYVHNEHRIIFE